jgi:hypothetical protein
MIFSISLLVIPLVWKLGFKKGMIILFFLFLILFAYFRRPGSGQESQKRTFEVPQNRDARDRFEPNLLWQAGM